MNLYIQSRAVCNSDEVVTGGGYTTNYPIAASSGFSILENHASGNGWTVLGHDGPDQLKAVVECAKLS
jgi:hypothetical protein